MRLLKTKEGRAQYRAMLVPADAVRDPRSSEAAEAFTYTAREHPCAIGFFGSSAKPHFRSQFRDEAGRDRYITEFFANAAADKARVAERRAKRTAFKHTLKVGDIVHSSWGYDQTNVRFFEVTRVVSEKSVAVRQVKCKTVRVSGPMAEYVAACPGEFCGEERVRLVREGNIVCAVEYSYPGFPGAGPQYSSWYA